MTPPNIILILTDHFRRDALHPDITPNLLNLAQSGTRFSNAYSSAPLCQPARNCIITGRHASDNGICGNQQPPLSATARQDTFMRQLQQAGYTTALVGKHHYIDRYGIGMDVTDDDDLVRKYGFDQVVQVLDDGENQHNSDEYTRWLAAEGKLEAFRSANIWTHEPFPLDADVCADAFIGANGLRLVEELAGQTPFYLNLSFIGPHPPFWHPGETRPGLADHMTLKEAEPSDHLRFQRARYLEKCAIIDQQIGRLIAALSERNVLTETTIIFTSDHGDLLGDRGIWDKRQFYEESVGVPLILAGTRITGEQRQSGARLSKALVSHLDLYPTILDLAGIPQDRDPRRPGTSLLRLLDESAPGHDQIVAELATAMMIRTANWKLVYDPQAGGVQQLFNLAVDPDERQNLAGVAGYEAITSQMVQYLLDDKIRRTQTTHVKEEQRLQRVHIS